MLPQINLGMEGSDSDESHNMLVLEFKLVLAWDLKANDFLPPTPPSACCITLYQTLHQHPYLWSLPQLMQDVAGWRVIHSTVFQWCFGVRGVVDQKQGCVSVKSCKICFWPSLIGLNGEAHSPVAVVSWLSSNSQTTESVISVLALLVLGHWTSQL